MGREKSESVGWEGGFDDEFVETAFSAQQANDAIDAERLAGVRDAECAFLGGVVVDE